MKKLAAASATAILTLALLASCANNSGPSAPDTSKPAGSTPVTNEQTTDAPLTTAPVTTAPMTTDASADTEAEQTQTLALNEDMLAYYGMTFDELEAKYGECFAYEYITGGPAYAFKNGYGWCCFYGWPYYDPQNASEWIYDEDGNKAFAKPEKEARCYVLDMGKAEDLFNQSFDTLKLSEIDEIEGVKLVGPYDHDGSTRFAHATLFSYEGFKYPETELIIYHDEEDSITPDSMVHIFLHSDYVKD